jgi:hypothetical protein
MIAIVHRELFFKTIPLNCPKLQTYFLGTVDDDIKQNMVTLCKFGVRVSTGEAAKHQAPNSHGRSSSSRHQADRKRTDTAAGQQHASQCAIATSAQCVTFVTACYIIIRVGQRFSSGVVYSPASSSMFAPW